MCFRLLSDSLSERIEPEKVIPMSRVQHHFDQQAAKPFTSIDQIESYLLAKTVHAKGLIGTEIELFVTKDGQPPSFDTIETLFDRIAAQLQPEYDVSPMRDGARTVGLHIPDLGDVMLEPGGQVELATTACATPDILKHKNRILRAVLDIAGASLGMTVAGTGHDAAFLQAEDMPRSRFAAYYQYVRFLHGPPAEDLLATMKSCCGLQINLDPMGADFHEVARALLLIEMTQVLTQPSTRRQRFHETYTALFPEQTTPLFDILAARTNEEVIHHMAARLMTLKVPFLPDGSLEGFVPTLDLFDAPPTVRVLMEMGQLTPQLLDNCLGLQLTMPNLRRHGVLETRAPDSVQAVEEIVAITQKYVDIAYNPARRKALLAATADIDPHLLQKAYEARFTRGIGDDRLGPHLTVRDLATCIENATSRPAPVIKPASP